MTVRHWPGGCVQQSVCAPASHALKTLEGLRLTIDPLKKLSLYSTVNSVTAVTDL